MTVTKTTDDTKKPLPIGWRWVRLGEVCEINPRRSDITRQDMESTSFVPMEAVDAEMGVIFETRARPFADVKKGYTYFENGDVLFAKITPCMQNGKHAIAHNLIEGIGFASTEFHVIRPAKRILADWIHFFVRQPVILHDATNHFTGAVGQQRVPDEFLRSLEIPLPPLSEQRLIAGVLREQMAAVVKARAAAQARLAAIKDLPAAFLRQVFPQPGQPLPAGWRWIKLGEVAQLTNGRAYSADELLEHGKYPILRVGNLFTSDHWYYSDLELEPQKYCDKGDLLYAWSASFGPFIWSGPKVIYHYHIWKVICGNKLDTEYACHALEVLTARIKRDSHGVAMLHMTKDGMEHLELPLPPINEQQRIAGVLREQMTSVEHARTSAKEELQTINALPAALLRRAFNGEL